MSDLPMDDDQLVARLRSALDELDPPPAGLRDTAVRALTWDLERAALADLVHDSDVTPALAGMRSAVDAGPRDLVFQRGEVTLDVSIEPRDDGTGALVTGSVVGVDAEHVLLMRVPGRGTTQVVLDEFGRFEAEVDGRRVVLVVPGAGGEGRDLRTDVLPLR